MDPSKGRCESCGLLCGRAAELRRWFATTFEIPRAQREGDEPHLFNSSPSTRMAIELHCFIGQSDLSAEIRGVQEEHHDQAKATRAVISKDLYRKLQKESRAGMSREQIIARDRLLMQCETSDGAARAIFSMQKQLYELADELRDRPLKADESFTPSLPDWKIIQALAKSPHAMSQLEIIRATNEGERTVKDHLQILERARLVHRPHGVRSGYCLTAAGRDLARRFDEAAEVSQPLGARAS